ncbi:MAG: acyl-CoA/acyl-ACP dehydrogenase [Novosphingobium sp.]|nr:acyl-CoA/acyl-ACP dehydrogenase [Novosphingobium sp.]
MIELSELRDAAQKAFPADQLVPDRDKSWELMAEMGWLMMRPPEELGGLGLGRDASTMIHFELGRVLSSAPVLPAMLAIEAIAASDCLADKEDWIERACTGELITTSLGGGSAQLEGGAISAKLPNVPDADLAGHVLVFVPGLVALVPLDAQHVESCELEMWDCSRRLFEVTLDAVTPDETLVIARGDAADALADRLLGELSLALAADCLGGANAAIELTVEFLKMRKQFDRPLAMFQVLKHRCADLKTQVVSAEALLWSRAGNADATTTDLGALKTLAAEVYQFVTEEAIQMHGGIGLTDEHQCHLFMKRAMLNLAMGGMPDEWHEAAGRQALVDIASA